MKLKEPLEGKHIVIRNYEKPDLSFLTEMWFDEENGTYMSDPTRAYADDRYQSISYWCQGFGTDIVTLLLEWLERNGASKVMAEVAVDNLPSNRLLQKFGFEVERASTFRKYNMDVRFDSCIYAKELLPGDAPI